MEESTHLQAHCQSPTSQHINQSFVKELAKPSQVKNFKIFLHAKKKKIKTRQHTGDIDRKENETNDKFNMKVQFDSDTRTDKNRQCITSGICNRLCHGFCSLPVSWKIVKEYIT